MALLLKNAHAIDPQVGLDETCEILVRDGRIEAEGTHDALMAGCPLYASMYNAHMESKDAA